MAIILTSLVPTAIGKVKPSDSIMLFYLAGLGVILFTLTLTSGFVFRHLSYLLSYLSPLFISVACYSFLSNNEDIFKRVLSISAVIWIGVCTIQKFFDVGFLTFLVSDSEFLGENLSASGRGVIGLAPESTHNGFQMFIIGAALYISGGNKILSTLCCVFALYFSGSASLLLAGFVGSFIWASFNPIKNIWYFAALLIGLITLSLSLSWLNPDTRVARLINLLINDRANIVYFDASVSARIGGMILPIQEIITSGLWPNGMSVDAWAKMRWKLIAENPWVYSLSFGGPASGFGLILVHAGIFALPPLIYFIKIFIVDMRNHLIGMLFSICFFIFLSQIYLATPSFGVMLAVAFYSRDKLA